MLVQWRCSPVRPHVVKPMTGKRAITELGHHATAQLPATRRSSVSTARALTIRRRAQAVAGCWKNALVFAIHSLAATLGVCVQCMDIHIDHTVGLRFSNG